MITKEFLKKRITQIQNGEGIDKRDFPDSMKGEIAKQLWDDSIFTYGLEYGALIILNELILEIEQWLIK